MDDSFSKMFAIILSVIMLCVIPAFYLAMLCDLNNYYYQNNYMKTKLDEAIYKGKIDDVYFITNSEVVVYRDEYFPLYEEEKTVSYTNDTIKKCIENDKVFKLEVGDTIEITYKNNFSKVYTFINKIFNLNLDNNYITYSGVVKNESY